MADKPNTPPASAAVNTPPAPPATPPVADVATVDQPTVTTEAVVTAGPEAILVARTEEARVSTDSGGFARSGEIVASNLPTDVFGRAVLPRSTAVVMPESPAGARTRVLASGEEVAAHVRSDNAGEERIFTAATRILRSRKIYDPGAPVPLTRAEFVEKAASRAVRETLFADGLPDDD